MVNWHGFPGPNQPKLHSWGVGFQKLHGRGDSKGSHKQEKVEEVKGIKKKGMHMHFVTFSSIVSVIPKRSCFGYSWKSLPSLLSDEWADEGNQNIYLQSAMILTESIKKHPIVQGKAC